MILIPIDDILRTTTDGVKVRISSTGAEAWVPRNDVLFIPGAMMVPGWLGKKLLAPPKTAHREPAFGKSRASKS